MNRKVFGTFLIVFALLLFGVSSYLKQNKINSIKEEADAINEMLEGNRPIEGFSDDVWGIIVIEKINVYNTIKITDDYTSMYRYLMAFPQTTPPPGTGNFAITGHNSTCANCSFSNLYRLQAGDSITLKSRDGIFTYKVTETFVIPKERVDVLDDIEGETTLTLITCTYTSLSDPNRQVVRAKLISHEVNKI